MGVLSTDVYHLHNLNFPHGCWNPEEQTESVPMCWTTLNTYFAVHTKNVRTSDANTRPLSTEWRHITCCLLATASRPVARPHGRSQDFPRVGAR